MSRSPSTIGSWPVGSILLLSACCPGVLGYPPVLTNLCLHLVRYRLEVLALYPLAARGAVREPLCVGFARFLIVEKYPVVLFPGPPELPQIWCFCSHVQCSAA